jgi:quinol monooxygenase YgiN
MTRKIVDCRDVPNEVGCTLALTGEADEVVEAAARHAVDVHGHEDSAELRDMVRAGMRDAPLTASAGSFVQIVEFATDRIDEFEAAADEWLRDIGADRTAQWFVVAQDRQRKGRYIEVVGFPDHDAAMRNSDHPATARIAKRMSDMCGGDIAFRDLDVVSGRTP